MLIPLAIILRRNEYQLRLWR